VIQLCIASAVMAYVAGGIALHSLVVAANLAGGRKHEPRDLAIWSVLWPVPVALALVAAVGAFVGAFVRGFRRGGAK
jgi:ABC-type Na+ efflux pump permease subunit